MICDNCMYTFGGQKLCALCYLAAKNNSNRKSCALNLNDDDFLFDSTYDDTDPMGSEMGSVRSQGGSFHKTTVSRNTSTGEI